MILPRAVIFDVDGTLIDTVDLHAASWAETLRRYGCDVAYDAVRRQIGKGGDQLMPVFLSDEMVATHGEEIEAFRKKLFMSSYIAQARPFPGVRDLLLRVRASGQLVVLASSAQQDELTRYQAIAGIEDVVDAATSSDDAQRSKPFPDIFLAALKRIAPLGANDAVAVGDTPYDAQAAGGAGIKTVGLLSGGFPETDLRSAGCIAIYRNASDLLVGYDASPLACSRAASNQGH